MVTVTARDADGCVLWPPGRVGLTERLTVQRNGVVAVCVTQPSFRFGGHRRDVVNVLATQPRAHLDVVVRENHVGVPERVDVRRDGVALLVSDDEAHGQEALVLEFHLEGLRRRDPFVLDEVLADVGHVPVFDQIVLARHHCNECKGNGRLRRDTVFHDGTLLSGDSRTACDFKMRTT